MYSFIYVHVLMKIGRARVTLYAFLKLFLLLVLLLLSDSGNYTFTNNP